MKVLVGMIVFFLLGFFLGMYNGYTLVQDVTIDNVGALYASAVTVAQTGYTGSALQGKVNEQQKVLDKAVTAKKEEMKEQMRQEIQKYAQDKINSRFGISPSK
jgi:hypothetical protein